MADIWFDVDTALAEVPINLMPLIDDTDFKSREVALTYNQAGLDLVWNFITTGGAMSQTAVTPTASGGAYDWQHIGDGMYTIEIPASGGATINNDTEGFGWFTGVATGVLPWRSPIFGFRAAAINNSLIDGATVDVTVTALADDVITAGKFDESTAFPLKSADADSTKVARVGADGDTLETLSDQLDTAQTDLDNPAQYKADVSGIPAAVWGYATRTLSSFGTLVADIWGYVTRTLTAFGFTVATNSDANVTAIKAKTDNLPADTETTLAAIQTDLDNPSQYKADVSGLATASALSAISVLVDDLETRLTAARAGYLDKLNVSGILANSNDANNYKADVSGLLTTAGYTAPDNAGITAIKAKTDNLPVNTATALSAIQADLDNPDQYKADVSGLALEATLTAMKGVGWTDETLVAIKAAINAGGVDEATIRSAIGLAAANLDMQLGDIQTDLDNPDQYKADVSSLALESTLTAMKGAGWSDETLVTLMAAIEAISAGSGATAQEVWEYATRVLTAGTNIDLSALATADNLAAVKSDTAAILADTGTDGVVVASGQTVATVTNLTNLPTMPADWVTASGLKADAVTEIQSGLALEATLTAIKGAGWTTETLVTLKAYVDEIETRLTATRAGYLDKLNVTGTLAHSDAAAAYKADVSGLAPANEYDAQLSAIQADLNNPAQYRADVSGLATQESVNAIPTTPLLATNYTAPDNAGITAIKAQTDLIPASPAPANEYDARMTAIQSDLDNTAQYKADVSGLALEATSQSILEDTGTTIPAAITGMNDIAVSDIMNEIVVGTYTFEQILKILAAKMAGKATGGATTTITYRGLDDTSDVIVETVDSNGNRSAVTLTV
jgi:hypothetical protein